MVVVIKVSAEIQGLLENLRAGRLSEDQHDGADQFGASAQPTEEVERSEFVSQRKDDKVRISRVDPVRIAGEFEELTPGRLKIAKCENRVTKPRSEQLRLGQ